MSASHLTRGLLIAALCLVSQATALASPCGDAARNYNRISHANDDWYIRAFERATGVPVASTISAEYCPTLLPIYRERLRRHRATLAAYRTWKSTCNNPHEDFTPRDGLRAVSSPQVHQTIIHQIQVCELALSRRHARVDIGTRTCTNQRERCISYRRLHGPSGSERVCVRVYRACLRSGIWDGAAAFPYGGALITGMTRR